MFIRCMQEFAEHTGHLVQFDIAMNDKSDITLKNDPNYRLTRFLGRNATSAARLEAKHTGWIRLPDGVQVLAYSLEGTIHAGREVVVVGVDGNRLIVKAIAVSEPELLQRISGIIANLGRTLKEKDHLLLADAHLADEDADAALEEFEKAEEVTLDPDTFLTRLETRAQQAIDEGDLDEASRYYRKLCRLKLRYLGADIPEDEDGS